MCMECRLVDFFQDFFHRSMHSFSKGWSQLETIKEQYFGLLPLPFPDSPARKARSFFLEERRASLILFDMLCIII